MPLPHTPLSATSDPASGVRAKQLLLRREAVDIKGKKALVTGAARGIGEAGDYRLGIARATLR